MSRLLKTACALPLLALLAGCGTPGGHPNPPPPPGYKVVCGSWPGFFATYVTSCRPAQGPVIEERVLVRAKG